jgi:hypothetical protein
MKVAGSVAQLGWHLIRPRVGGEDRAALDGGFLGPLRTGDWLLPGLRIQTLRQAQCRLWGTRPPLLLKSIVKKDGLVKSAESQVTDAVSRQSAAVVGASWLCLRGLEGLLPTTTIEIRTCNSQNNSSPTS